MGLLQTFASAILKVDSKEKLRNNHMESIEKTQNPLKSSINEIEKNFIKNFTERRKGEIKIAKKTADSRIIATGDFYTLNPRSKSKY